MRGDKVEKVIVIRRIVDSLCVLTTSEYGWFAKMEVVRDNSMTSHMVSKRTIGGQSNALHHERVEEKDVGRQI